MVLPSVLEHDRCIMADPQDNRAGEEEEEEEDEEIDDTVRLIETSLPAAITKKT